MNIVSIENINSVLDEVRQAFFDIPFENSAFQTENFVVAAQVTPARAYRAIGLRMHSKIQAVLEAKYNRAKEDVDLDELQYKIENPETNDFDRRRAILERDFKLEARPYTDKLLNDAISELNLLYSHFQSLPKFSRAEFEAQEREHFEVKLTRQIQGTTGAYEALQNMQSDLPALNVAEQQYIENLTVQMSEIQR